MNLTERYKKLIENWICSMKEYVAEPFDRRELAYYGTGTDVWAYRRT